MVSHNTFCQHLLEYGYHTSCMYRPIKVDVLVGINQVHNKVHYLGSFDNLDRFDIYSGEVPQLNFEGRTRAHTTIGLLLSLLVYISVGGYMLVKFTDFYRGYDPIVNNDLRHGMSREESNGLTTKTK